MPRKGTKITVYRCKKCNRRVPRPKSEIRKKWVLCKDCDKLRSRLRRRQARPIQWPEGTKLGCGTCDKALPLEAFERAIYTRRGYQRECRKCKEKMARYKRERVAAQWEAKKLYDIRQRRKSELKAKRVAAAKRKQNTDFERRVQRAEEREAKRRVRYERQQRRQQRRREAEAARLELERWRAENEE